MDRVIKIVAYAIGLAVVLALFWMLVIALINPSGRVKTATSWDYIHTVEHMETGAARVWLRHDDIGAYCTTDPELIRLANLYGGKQVVINFSRVNWGSDEYSGVIGADGCSSTDVTGVTVFKLTSIELDEGR